MHVKRIFIAFSARYGLFVLVYRTNPYQSLTSHLASKGSTLLTNIIIVSSA